MEVRDLRIGNYVHCKISNDAALYYVTKITYSSVVLSGVRDKEVIDIERIKPIPLTPEILAKCDIKKHNSYTVGKGGTKHRTYELGGQLYLSKSAFQIGGNYAIEHHYCCGEGNEETEICTIDYLHELQNWYFLLTGKDFDLS